MNAAPTPPPIGTRDEYIAALRWGFEQATQGRARRIVCVAPGFADWPLDEPALIERLSAWMRLPQRRLVLLARDFDAVVRRHPRFVAWRVTWAHAIDARAPASDDTTVLPSLLLDDQALCVHLRDAERWRGRAECDRRAARLWHDQIDALLQRSEPAFSTDKTGL